MAKISRWYVCRDREGRIKGVCRRSFGGATETLPEDHPDLAEFFAGPVLPRPDGGATMTIADLAGLPSAKRRG